MKTINFDYTTFCRIRKMLKNVVYWLDKNNNYKIYKFEISRIEIEPDQDNDLVITIELSPIDTNKFTQYCSNVYISYDTFDLDVVYSYDAARKLQAKKLYERQGSLF